MLDLDNPEEVIKFLEHKTETMVKSELIRNYVFYDNQMCEVTGVEFKPLFHSWNIVYICLEGYFSKKNKGELSECYCLFIADSQKSKNRQR